MPATVPRLVSLPELLHASDEDPSRAVKQLLDTGTTGLGGARPKASVRLEDGSLAIAKFPHSSDRWDVMAWEATALDVMEAGGIRVLQRRLARVGERSVLILRRFDRAGEELRVGCISAMTALSAADGEHRDYAEIAEAMRDLSLSPRTDHHELFGRSPAGLVVWPLATIFCGNLASQSRALPRRCGTRRDRSSQRGLHRPQQDHQIFARVI